MDPYNKKEAKYFKKLHLDLKHFKDYFGSQKKLEFPHN